ncbi:hypothetical protein D3C84_1113000 [compost metagenome]
MPLFGRGVSLQFRLESFVGLDTFGAVAAGVDQGFGVGTLAFMAFAQGFEDIHGVSSSVALWNDAY